MTRITSLQMVRKTNPETGGHQYFVEMWSGNRLKTSECELQINDWNYWLAEGWHTALVSLPVQGMYEATKLITQIISIALNVNQLPMRID